MRDQDVSRLLGRDAQRKQERKQAILDALAAGAIPVSGEIRDAIANLFITDALEVLRFHPGFDLEDKIRSIRTTLQLFDQAAADLTEALAAFDTFSRRPEFSYRSHRAEHEAIERRIRKEVFAFSELAHSLQDHCRRIRSRWENPSIAQRIPLCFREDGLHDFICGLRTALHHKLMVDADWEIRGSGPEATSHYLFKRSELMDTDADWNSSARRYLASAGDVIDVGTVASLYHRRVHDFYDHLLGEADTDPPPAVADYRHCWTFHRQRSARMTWNLLINEFLKRNIDPYAYLERYLTPHELEAVRLLPQSSREQVDFIVRAADEFSACDDNLRAAIYRLFRVPAETIA
ncbi:MULTISPECIES: hypothetical protein [Rhizobium]|uniref:Uncharacterized protein n=1 Tax=Rhizobium aouanii TaxID=3118145 RepID=A0ABU8CJ11_9HYPH|nr:hypothetical protein [Rhizobium acaciae]MCW1410736.1 hypothetical protein [Rhizobium acaciae]MCW1742965.1 hypothetical protein [Rhizobium acaciae]MCW1750161.1 hypothetical protein [Rhizobium acaciae]